MIKKTQFIDILTTIKRNCIAFLSILLFVTLSVSVFTGISWSAQGAVQNVDTVLENGNMHDIYLYFPYGMSEEELNSFLELEGVDQVEGSRSIYENLSLGSERYQLKVSEVNDTIDTSDVVEGHLPEKAGEIALERITAKRLGLNVGDQLTFDPNKDNTLLLINGVEKAELSLEGMLDMAELFFVMCGQDTKSYLTTESFTVTALVNNPECTMRSESWYGTAITTGQKIQGFAYVAEESFDKAAFPGYTDILIRSESLRGLGSTTDAYLGRLESIKSAVSGLAGQYSSAKYQGIAEKTDAVNEIIDLVFESDLDPIAYFEEHGVTVPQELADEFNYLFDKASEKAAEFKSMTSLLTENGFYSFTREHHIGLQAALTVAQIMNKIRFSMSGLFVIVGLLVCYFAILRIVNHQIKLIGTQKAIGFRAREITRKYLLFTGIAVIMGCILGALIGCFMVEPIIFRGLKTGFTMNHFNTLINFKEFALISLLEIGLLILITWLASKSILKRNAVDLLAGERPPSGKERFYEKFPVFRRMSLLNKTIVNNFFTDKRRVLGTFVGIAGCTSLLISAFSLNDNVLGSFDEQFTSIYHFDRIVAFDAGDINTQEEIRNILEENGFENALVSREAGAIKTPDGSALNAYMLVAADGEAFESITDLQTAFGEKESPYQGIWMSHAYKNYYKDKAGDRLKFYDRGGSNQELELNGFIRDYLAETLIIMDRETYLNVYGKEVSANSFLVRTKAMDLGQFSSLFTDAGINCRIINYRSDSYGMFRTFSAVSKAMIAVYVMLAVLMAFLVLLNLLNMFVEEKKMELIVLMINGFSVKAVKKYISGDTVILTIAGIIGGIIIGGVVGLAAVNAFNTFMTSFMNRISLSTLAVGVVGTSVISFVMCQIALRKISKFKLSDINK